jgi:hypothetical protein
VAHKLERIVGAIRARWMTQYSEPMSPKFRRIVTIAVLLGMFSAAVLAAIFSK